MDKIKESFFINRKTKEVFSRTVWSRKFIKILNSEETENIILKESPEVFVNYERDNLTLIPQTEILSLWESDLKNHIADNCSFSVEEFEKGYCYMAELWKAKYGKKVIILDYFH